MNAATAFIVGFLIGLCLTDLPPRPPWRSA